eukprot:11190205-Prorocentrum_lima.AAC.1
MGQFVYVLPRTPEVLAAAGGEPRDTVDIPPQPREWPQWDTQSSALRAYELDMYSETHAPATYTAPTIPPTLEAATVFCRLPGVPPLQPHSDVFLLRCGEVPQGWTIARVNLWAANEMQVAKHLLLPEECRLGYLYYLVATNP